VSTRSVLLVLGLLSLLLRCRAELPPTGPFARTNLVAWCVVPFDSRKRGPEERAEMLQRLGLRRLAYDWRSEHLPTFDAEVAAMRRHGIEITAWWFPADLGTEARAILDCIRRNRIHPQLWITMGTEDEPDATRLDAKIDAAVRTLSPICREAQSLGCRVALYNHLGWFGEPRNLVEVLARLRKSGHTNAGVVYNFHHAHGHIDDFESQFRILQPHLLALNLNGMVWNGDRVGRKIIPLGTGDEELDLLRVVAASGWKGDVGIIGHTDEDAEVKLRKELDGLERLAPRFGEPRGPRKPRPVANPSVGSGQTAGSQARSAGEPAVSGKEPGSQAEKDWVDNRWQATDVGPFLATTLALPDKVTVAKGLAVRLDGGAVAYDMDRAEVRGVWSGGFLKFDPTRFGLIGTPRPDGEVLFAAGPRRNAGTNAARWSAIHRTEAGVVLEYRIGETRILERPRLLKTTAGVVLERTFTVAVHPTSVSLPLTSHLRGGDQFSADETSDSAERGRIRRVVNGYADDSGVRSGFVFLSTKAGGDSLSWSETGWGGHVAGLEASNHEETFVAYLWRGPVSAWELFLKEAKSKEIPTAVTSDPARLSVPVVETRGQRGMDNDFLAVDTLTLPYENADKALLFGSGIDFGPDGSGFLATIHGDVWRVTGVDDSLQRLRWTRFATGMYQPLGLKVRDGEVFVLGRDRITRLRDRNGDGVADSHESFHDGIATSTGGHDYVTCLEVDSSGRFYYVDPLGLHRVSGDGRVSELLAAGFRNPNGMGVSPDGAIRTVSPQQGTWTPSSEIAEIREGGWYGYGGPRKEAANGLGRNWPLCWIPHGVDNSSGSQAWVPNGQWGPLGGQMLHLLWGRCGMMLVLRDTSGLVPQGAVVPLPVKFQSGPNRATFRASENALYVAGSTGWQTSAVKDGALQRVRFTDKPVRVPVGWRQDGNALEFRFAVPLERSTASDPGSYALKRWNYRYAEEYGSKDWSVADPSKNGRDDVAVTKAALLPDGRTIRLELADAVPAMQYELRYNVDLEGKGTASGQLWFSVHPR
jgi:sugar phosphate isomerase/epimerase